MAYSFPPDVKLLIDSRMASGKYATEDELLRDALDALDAEATELEAIQAAITDWRAGDPGVPLDEAFDQIRHRHNIPTDA